MYILSCNNAYKLMVNIYTNILPEVDMIILYIEAHKKFYANNA